MRFFSPILVVLLFAVSLATKMVGAQTQEPRSDQGGAITRDQYRHLLADYRKANAKGLSTSEASQWRKRFEIVNEVILPDGKRVSLDNASDLKVLKSAEKPGRRSSSTENNTLKSRISLLERLSETPSPSPSIRNLNDRDPGEQAKAILSAKEFAPEKPVTQQKNLIAQALEWIDKQWKRLWKWLFPAQGKMKEIPWLAQFTIYLLYAILGVAALVGAFYLARFFLARQNQKQRKTRKAVQDGMDMLYDIPDPLGASRQSALRGDYRTALRLAYIASLRRLAGNGYLVLQENRTNWEYQNAVRRRSDSAYTTLLPATRLFDAVWYGGRSATASEYQSVIDAHDALPAVAYVPANSVSNQVEDERNASSMAPATRAGNDW